MRVFLTITLLLCLLAPAFGLLPYLHYLNDFNGDSKADLAVYQPNIGSWYIRHSDTNKIIAVGTNWGASGMVPVANDFNKDYIDDLALYHKSTGNWYVRTLNNALIAWGANWGGSGMVPVPGDYNRDEFSDLAVYHLSTGNWYIRTLNNALIAWGSNWGGPGMVPVPGDYNRDNCFDLAVYHESTGNWYIRSATNNAVYAFGLNWGGPGMVPVSGDYNGDGFCDLAVYQESSGRWYILSFTNRMPIVYGVNFGGPGMIPVPGDYDHDQRADLAVYQEATGKWYIYSPYKAKVIVWGASFGWNETIPAYYTKAYYGAPINITGAWNLSATGYASARLDLKQTDSTVTGTASNSAGSSPVAGFVDGNACRMTIGSGSDPMRLVGYVAGNSINGTYSTNYGNQGASFACSRILASCGCDLSKPLCEPDKGEECPVPWGKDIRFLATSPAQHDVVFIGYTVGMATLNGNLLTGNCFAKNGKQYHYLGQRQKSSSATMITNRTVEVQQTHRVYYESRALPTVASVSASGVE